MPPGLGDSIQAMKAGIQEVADVFVVTKGDMPGSDQLYRQLRAVARRAGDDKPRPVFLTSSNDGTGLPDIVDEIAQRAVRKGGALHELTGG
jgi:LAO/AO transport system kinase